MTTWLLIALLPAAGTITCLLRARSLRREGVRSIPEPPSPPDFSALGDGSQRWKAFEDFT